MNKRETETGKEREEGRDREGMEAGTEEGKEERGGRQGKERRERRERRKRREREIPHCPRFPTGSEPLIFVAPARLSVWCSLQAQLGGCLSLRVAGGPVLAWWQCLH